MNNKYFDCQGGIGKVAGDVRDTGHEYAQSDARAESFVRASYPAPLGALLLAAEGLPNAEIGRRVGMTRQTVIAWRARYEAGGIQSLADLPRSGRPPVIDEPAVITSTLNAPPDALGVTHWSARLLADHLTRGGMPVSFAEVARIWRDWGLQPHRSETFKFSTDPQPRRDIETDQRQELHHRGLGSHPERYVHPQDHPGRRRERRHELRPADAGRRGHCQRMDAAVRNGNRVLDRHSLRRHPLHRAHLRNDSLPDRRRIAPMSLSFGISTTSPSQATPDA